MSERPFIYVLFLFDDYVNILCQLEINLLKSPLSQYLGVVLFNLRIAVIMTP